MRSEEDQNRNRFFYRVEQFWATLRTPLPNESDLIIARSVLTDRQMVLFSRLHPSEQAHGLRVLKTIRDQGEMNSTVLAAALLHDIGKTCHSLRLWERVVIVLVKWMFPKKIERWGSAQPKGWKRPFVVACKHPLWGAELVSEAGAEPLLVDLIREHQRDLSNLTPDSKLTHLLTVLQRADNQN